MIHAQNTKFVLLDDAATGIASNATSSSTYVVDTRGYDFASVYIQKLAATDTNVSAKWITLQVLEGSTTDLTNCTAVNGTIGTTNATATATQFVLPGDNTTADDEVITLHIDWKTKNRYLALQRTGAACHNTTTAWCILSRPNAGVDKTTALAGGDKIVHVA